MSTPPEKNVEKKVPPGPGDEDGSFNTLTGAARITSKDARQVSPGLYRMNIKDPGESMVWRFFLLFDGKQQRMEQHSKRKCGKLKKPEELNPFEWTLVDRTMLYFRLPEGKTPETVRGELPRLANGVGVYGGSEYVVVKNLIAKHFWNDGYNIHNASKNITFENIAAISAGDWKRLWRRVVLLPATGGVSGPPEALFHHFGGGFAIQNEPFVPGGVVAKLCPGILLVPFPPVQTAEILLGVKEIPDRLQVVRLFHRRVTAVAAPPGGGRCTSGA